MGFSSGGQTPFLKPSGDQGGSTDVATINRMISNGLPVFLIPGEVYYINSPILPVNNTFITGFQWNMSSQDDNYGAGIGQPGGALIRSVNFNGPALIYMPNQTSQQFYGVDISGIALYSDASIGSGVFGIGAFGAWGACFLRGIQIQKSGGDCLNLDVYSPLGKVPDDWQVTDCKFSGSRHGCGVNVTNNLPDSWFDNCESSENALDNWKVHWCDNTRWSNCKGENSVGGVGWHFTGNGSAHIAMLTGCSSQNNFQDGFLFDNSVGGGNGEYILTGCRADGDNTSAGAFAGFHANGSPCRIMGTGCHSSGAAYGAYEGGASFGMCFTGSYFSGTTAPTHDDGTNTHALVNQSPVPF